MRLLDWFIRHTPPYVWRRLPKRLRTAWADWTVHRLLDAPPGDPW